MEDTARFVSLENTTYLKSKDFDGYNFVNENNVQERDHKSEIYEAIGIMVVYSVFCLLGIIGNGLVIWFSIFRMKKTVNVVWFLNLAIADFSFALFCPWNYTQLLLGYGGFSNMCKVIHFLLYLTLGISVNQITVISIDRCLCVVFPVWCHNHRRPRLAYITVLVIWMISFAGAMAAINDSKKISVNDYFMLCLFIADETTLKRRTVLEFVLEFLLPLIIIVSCYISIVLHVRRKRIVTSSRPFKTSMAVVITFFISWFPIHVHFFLERYVPFDPYVHKYLYFSSNLLLVVNSCINPILYVFIGRDFQEKFCGSFQVKLEKAFTEYKPSPKGLERSIPLESLH